MDSLRDKQLAWLNHIVTSGKTTLTEVARAAGLDPSTLTRFHNSNKDGHTLTSTTVTKIERSSGIPAYESRPLFRPLGMQEEAAPYDPTQPTANPLEIALREISKQSNSLDMWVLKSSALSAAGYQAGDIVLVDRDRQPRPGDAVCAQVYDHRRGTAETIFRIFRQPYLLTASLQGEPGLPEIVDNDSVVIMGVILGGCHLPNLQQAA